MRTGSESGVGTSEDNIAGTQYSRMKLPIGVPGPTRVISSFSSCFNMCSILLRFGRGHRIHELFADLLARFGLPGFDEVVVFAELAPTWNDVDHAVLEWR